MPPHSFTISSLSLGFTAFSEQACWKVKIFAGASSNRKSYNKEVFASILNMINTAPAHRPAAECRQEQEIQKLFVS